MSIGATSVSVGHPSASSALPPLKLRRGNQSMILLYGFPPSNVRIALQRAGILVGTVAPTTALSGSLEQYDYVFVGSAGERASLFARAVRDCIRSGWSPDEAQHVLPQRSAATQAAGEGRSR